MGDTMETMIDDLPPYVAPNSYPPKHNPRKVVADCCREMGIEGPSTLTREQLEPFRLKKPEAQKADSRCLKPRFCGIHAKTRLYLAYKPLPRPFDRGSGFFYAAVRDCGKPATGTNKAP